MELQSSTRIRILFQTGENKYRKFYWIELKNKDLYWGASVKHAIENISIKTDNDREGQITIPETIETAEKIDSKYSYHESGQVHLKKTSKGKPNVYEKHSIWKLKEEIIEPKRFYAMITKPVIQYEEYNRKITADKNRAFLIQVASEGLGKRLYIEFFLSPKGTFKLPPSILEGKLCIAQEIPLNNELSLIIGLGNIIGMDEWHPDKEITFVPNNLD